MTDDEIADGVATARRIIAENRPKPIDPRAVTSGREWAELVVALAGTPPPTRVSWPLRMRVVDGQFHVASSEHLNGGLVKMGPLDGEHPLVTRGYTCPACGDPFRPDQEVTLVPLGPGSDPTIRAEARAGQTFTGEGAPVHWPCATGATDDDTEPADGFPTIDTTGWDEGVTSGNSTTGGL